MKILHGGHGTATQIQVEENGAPAVRMPLLPGALRTEGLCFGFLVFMAVPYELQRRRALSNWASFLLFPDCLFLSCACLRAFGCS